MTGHGGARKGAGRKPARKAYRMLSFRLNTAWLDRAKAAAKARGISLAELVRRGVEAIAPEVKSDESAPPADPVSNP